MAALIIAVGAPWTWLFITLALLKWETDKAERKAASWDRVAASLETLGEKALECAGGDPELAEKMIDGLFTLDNQYNS